MKVIHVASEVAPFSKTGGLADVAGSLPAALVGLGVETTVFSPCYPSVRKAKPDLETTARLELTIAGRPVAARLLTTTRDGVRHCFVDCPEYFDRPGLYGEAGTDYPDNALRFLVLCRATIAGADALGLAPDVIHCHDWQAGLLPLVARDAGNTATVFTIHNLGYQGNFPADTFQQLDIAPRHWAPADLEFYGQVSYLKAGLVHAGRLTTVSPTYAREIQGKELGFGMDDVLRARSAELSGILNGLDTVYWDPARDPHLAATYTPDKPEGKAANRRALAQELGLKADGPLFGMVSRLAGQKGVDLVIAEIPRLVRQGGRVCILGTGQPEYHTALEQLAREHPGAVVAVLAFDEPLAHRIYAASDYFLMPSEYEPCGLGQMIALRYGTLPIAARTGGLADTVFEVAPDASGGNGFLCERRDAAGYAAALDRALGLYGRPTALAQVRRRGMLTDFSWDARAREYLALYTSLAR